jgi:A/G-specific adenine glycosylase
MLRTATADNVMDDALRAWHGRSARSLVVREATDPWQVLVAEVMSQQTQIERIGPAWRRFVERWPAPSDLARAGTRELLEAWAGLGYNRRALALREAARSIVEEHGGAVPATVAELGRLPGIGPYTARAIAATAFGVPVAPLDVNIRRVLRRLTGLGGSAAELQEAADGLVWREDPRAWVNAVMDLAATVCTRRAPTCGACPLAAVCRSRGTTGDRDPRQRTSPVPFAQTNRWLRGRLLATVRSAPGDAWVPIPERMGEHGPEAIRAAAGSLAREGFLELDGDRVRLRGDQEEAAH